MNVAEKFIIQNTKTITIGEVPFLIRKANPEETYLLSKNLEDIRKISKSRAEKEEKEDCDDCSERLKLTSAELRQLTELDTKVILTRCVLSPKIVDVPFGQQKDNEIPMELIDNRTASTIFNEVQGFTLEVFEGVSLDSFPDEQTGEDVDRDKPSSERPSEPAGGFISTEDESSLKSEIGRILREGEEDGSEGSKRDLRRETRKTKRKTRKGKE